MPSYLNDVDFIRTRASIPTTYTDAQISEHVCDPIEQMIRTYLGYDPVSQTYTRFYNGSVQSPSRIALLPYTTAVTSVWENWNGFFDPDEFSTDQLLTAYDDYFLETVNGVPSGILTRRNTTWPIMYSRPAGRLASNLGPALGCVRVTFTAGMNPIEMAQVKAAGYLEATVLYRSWLNPVGSVTSDSMDGAAVTVNPYSFNRGDGLPSFASPQAEMMLRPLRKIPVV